VVIELSNSLASVENEVTVLLAFPVEMSLNQNDLSEKVLVRFVSLKRKSRIIQYLGLPFWIQKNWRDLKSFDVIHCHLTYGLFFGFLVSMRRKIGDEGKFNLIATCHIVGMSVAYSRRLLSERLSYFFDEFVLMAQDAHWRKFMIKSKKKNISVIANGISANPVIKNFSARVNHVMTIGTISRMHPERKPWLFLETFRFIRAFGNLDCRFVLGGEGVERAKLEMLSRLFGLEDTLSMPGLVADSTEFLSTIDLYITLVIEDVTGIAGLESVFSGVPVIGIQLSPTYENGPHDWIWSSPDRAEVARKALEYLEDPSSLSLLAKAQIEVARDRYSVEQMRNSYLLLYDV
jgi:glycosyltransferase involved in cell wall biosynthesis